MKKILVCICVLVILVSINIKVFASDDQQRALFHMEVLDSTESYVDLDILPGEQVTFSILLKNFNDSSLTNKLFVSDGITDNNGGTLIIPAEDAIREKAGSWLNFTEENITLEADEVKKIDFKVSVPEDITEGTYVAVIYLRNDGTVTEEINAGDNEAAFMIKQAYSFSAAVILRYGENRVYEFEIGETYEEKWIKEKDLVLEFLISNVGNIYDYTRAKINFYNSDDELIYEDNKDLNIAYPDNTFNLHFVIPPEMYVEDRYKIILYLEYGKNNEFLTSKEFILDLSADEVDNALGIIEEESQDNKESGSNTGTDSADTSGEYSVDIADIVFVFLGLLVLFAIIYTFRRIMGKKNKK